MALKTLKAKPKVLKQIRQARGWSLQMAAAHIGISHQALGYIENGFSRRPHRLTLEKIASTYEVPLEEIAS
jgi:transcriptional regulator with XRE-family HTH domain